MVLFLTDTYKRITLEDKELCSFLQNLAGSEKTIRLRQKLFLLIDLIVQKCKLNYTRISSGSIAEGLDLPGSDVDIMIVYNFINIIDYQERLNHPVQFSTFLMEDSTKHSGFTKLKLLAKGGKCSLLKSVVKSKNGEYLSNTKFLRDCIRMTRSCQLQVHGPCLSDDEQNLDFAFCFRSHFWPRQAKNWMFRHRPYQWPSGHVIERIIKFGCILVAIGPKIEENNDLLWRISFSMAEKELCHAFNYTQLLCYSLLKLTLKNIINRDDKTKDLLCSYFMKTVLFWVSEEVSINQFQFSELFHCFLLCIDKLMTCVDKCYCPNYFIPSHNMFKGKIDMSNKHILLKVLDRIKSRSAQSLLHHLFRGMDSKALSSLTKIKSATKLETLFFRTLNIDICNNIDTAFGILRFLKTLSKKESSIFMKDVCKFYHAFVSQHIIQIVPLSLVSNKYFYNIFRKLFRNSTYSDSITGWVLYATYYYKLEQYNVALKIIHYVLTSCISENMIPLNNVIYSSAALEYYQRRTDFKMLTLIDKMRMITLRDIIFISYSTMIPKELHYDATIRELQVPSVVMAFYLRYLCCHHTKDFFNREQALRDLRTAVDIKHYIASNNLSVCLMILGECFETSGDLQSAYHYYDSALHCSGLLSESAIVKKINIQQKMNRKLRQREM